MLVRSHKANKTDVIDFMDGAPALKKLSSVSVSWFSHLFK